MVKLKGPGMSESASGKLADVLTFARIKRGSYVKRHVRPTDPRTAPQIAIRASVKWLTSQWSTLTTAEKATWFTKSQQRSIANYHAYLSTNGSRFHNFLMPSKEDPATETPSGSFMKGCYLLKQYRTIKYHAKTTSPPIDWGYILCRSNTSGFTPGPQNTIAFFPKTPPAYDVYHDTNLDDGTYYYRCAGFNGNAFRTAFFTELTITLP